MRRVARQFKSGFEPCGSDKGSMAPPFRARACWAPARSAAEAADELRLRLAEARDALEEQRREHARLRKVKRAFEANLELRTRELELVVSDLNRCRRGAIARTSIAPPPAQMGGSAENRRVAVEATAHGGGRMRGVRQPGVWVVCVNAYVCRWRRLRLALLFAFVAMPVAHKYGLTSMTVQF